MIRPTTSQRAFNAGLRFAALGQAVRWRECWCCRVIVEQGRDAVLRYAQATYRDEDTVYRMAQAARAALILYYAEAARYRNAAERVAALRRWIAARRKLPYMHFAVAWTQIDHQHQPANTINENIRTAAETGASVRSMAGHTSTRLSLSLPLWDAATARDYLARVNSSGADVHLVLLEGAEWDGVKNVIVKPEKERK